MMRVAICIVRLVFLVFLARHDMAVAASSKLQKIYPYPPRGAVLAPASINAVDLSIQQQQQQQQAKDATEAHPLSQSQLQSQVFPVAPIVPTTVVARDHRRSKREKGRLINSLAFLNGAADVITYRKYRCYGNMMTGNIVKLSSALAELRWHDAFFYGSLVMSYILGVALFRTFELQVPKIQPSLSFLSFRSKTPTAMKSTAIATIATRTIPTSLAVSPVIALVFLLADVLSFPHTKVIQMPLLSIAFGLLNAAATEATGGVITFAMTGHVAKVGQAAADYVFVERKWRKGSKTSARAIFAFVSGLTLTSVVMELLNKANSNGCSTLASIVTKCVLPFMGKITNSSMNNTKQPQQHGQRLLPGRLGQLPISFGSIMGILYALLLGSYGWTLMNANSSSSNGNNIPSWKKYSPLPTSTKSNMDSAGSGISMDATGTETRPQKDATTSRRRRRSGIQMDGWTDVPAGPDPFHD